MSCPNNSESNNRRNVVKASTDSITYKPVVYVPNQPIWTRQYPKIDPRNVRLQPNETVAIGCVNVPKWDMQYSYGCTSCIRNDKVIFSP